MSDQVISDQVISDQVISDRELENSPGIFKTNFGGETLFVYACPIRGWLTKK